MEKKMIEVLNKTIRTYQAIYNDGNRKIADDVFHQFLAQMELVQEVTGKKVELTVVEGKHKVVLTNRD